MFELIPGGAEEMFYSTDGPEEKHRVGYMRMDFGDGGEFWSTWWPRSADSKHNTADFKAEMTGLVNFLRSGILKSAQIALRQVSALRLPCIDTDRRYYGFHILTGQHAYYVRLFPFRGDYSYVYCYRRNDSKA